MGEPWLILCQTGCLLYTSRGPVDHEVRDQIVAAATEHFRLYGYEKTTVSDLAKAIGFSKEMCIRDSAWSAARCTTPIRRPSCRMMAAC